MKNSASIVFSKDVVTRALKVSLLVGTVLALINHFSTIMTLSFTIETVLQIALTYCVPYAVSSYSSYQAIVNFDGTDGNKKTAAK